MSQTAQSRQPRKGFGLGADMIRVAADEALAGAGGHPGGRLAAEGATMGRGTSLGARFAVAKFRPAPLPAALVTRSALHDRLTAGAGQRLTLVAGSAGAGKSVLLSSWATARPAGLTFWLSCDAADADPVRFWAGFIEAARVGEPWFGADAADLLAMDGVVSADVTASIANDATMLAAGTAIVVDDFHYAAGSAARDMIALAERWPAETVQLVLSARVDPPLQLHRLRMAGELCELRDRDLCFSEAESGSCWPGSACRWPGLTWRCCISAPRGGPPRCRWRHCR